MTDVLLFNTDDGGEIEYINGKATLSPGLESAVYLSLFGGNDDHDGTRSTEHLRWWGNLLENDPAFRYVSRTQNVLRALPAIPANLPRVVDAINADLEWMKERLDADWDLMVSIPALNVLRIVIDFVIRDEEIRLAYEMDWIS